MPQINTEKHLVQKALEDIKTFGVGGRVYSPEQMAMSRIGYYTAKHGSPAQDRHEAYLTTLASMEPPTDAERAQVYLEAHEDAAGTPGIRLYGDPGQREKSKMHALASARIERVNNFIFAYPGFMSWYFDEVSLAPDEQAFILNETESEIAVTSIGEDGTPERNRFVKPQSVTPVGLFFKSTKIARYKTLDLYRGNVADRIRTTLNLPRDMRIELDLTYFGLLNLPMSQGGAFGAFSYENNSNNPQLRIWQAHSAIDTSQFPTTNDYDLTAAAGTANNPSPIGGLTGFDVNIILAIEDYCLRFGEVLGGPMVFTGDILVPAADISNVAVKFLPVANANEQGIQKQLTEQGYVTFNLWGRNIRLVPSLFLTRGTCYPKFNLKPGLAFMKPGLDRELTEVNVPENWEQTQLRKVIGAAIIAQWRPRVMRIKYSTASASSSTVTFHTWPSAPLEGGATTLSEASPYLS